MWATPTMGGRCTVCASAGVRVASAIAKAAKWMRATMGISIIRMNNKMSSAFTRRTLLAALPLARALAITKPLKISAIELWELRGRRETTRGLDQQYQINPLYIYDELRPA